MSTPAISHVDASATGGAPARAALRVALVNMPFGSTRYPSIQLGLLQAILRGHGIAAATEYLNLRFAARVGWERYEVLCDPPCRFLGEWLFAEAAFGERAPASGDLLDAFPDAVRRTCTALGCDPAELLRLRMHEAPAFIDDCSTALPWQQYDVVGFSSMFEQHCAALALARRIKERYPGIVTVFGGANVEDEMGLEYLRAVPWIDYAVIGEGDHAFPALLRSLAAGDRDRDVPGVARRNGTGVHFPGRAPLVHDLDALPDPDYDDYFATAAELGHPAASGEGVVHVMYETARGCWWGEKHHCTFCGLNALGMAYRSKSPRRVVAGLDELARRHAIYRFASVDNILDHRYIAGVFGPLAERHLDYAFFWAVKANLTREHLQAMAAGGVRRIQPGIESLSTHVLRLMRKGATAMQNVRLLKWALYYGISTAWNLLVGFPGEQLEDCDRQLAIMRLIPHLEPPGACTRLFLERFSPNYTEAAELGIANVRADRAYACVYPPGLDTERIAYFFDYDAPTSLPDPAHEPVREGVRRWQAAWAAPRRPYLTYVRGAGRLTVLDGRESPAGPPVAHVFGEAGALAYELCGSTYHTADRVRAELGGHGFDVDPADAAELLREFTARGLMLEEDGRYLALALPANPNW